MRIRLSLIVMMTVAGWMAAKPSAQAGTFEVAPTTIQVPADSVPTVFYVTNRGTDPIVAQVEGFNWHQADNKDQFDPTHDLIISPPMMRLLPGERQTVRLMVKPDPQANVERTFRLMVSEIPDPFSQTPHDKIRMLLQFSVPVFVAAQKITPSLASLVWNASSDNDGLKLGVHNLGANHMKIKDVVCETGEKQTVLKDGQAFHYILAGATYSWPAAAQTRVASGQTLYVQAQDENSGASIDTSLIVQ